MLRHCQGHILPPGASYYLDSNGQALGRRAASNDHRWPARHVIRARVTEGWELPETLCATVEHGRVRIHLTENRIVSVQERQHGTAPQVTLEHQPHEIGRRQRLEMY